MDVGFTVVGRVTELDPLPFSSSGRGGRGLICKTEIMLVLTIYIQ